MATNARPTSVRRYIHSSPTITAAHATTGSQNFSSHTPAPTPSSRGNGCGSVLHSIAASCWIISAAANVESTYRCCSSFASTGRTATTSVTTPTAAHATRVSTSPSQIGRPSFRMNIAPNTPPSMPSCPVVKLITRLAENITL